MTKEKEGSRYEKQDYIGTLKDSRNWFALAGILVGIIMVIMGFAAKGMFDRYGGDYRALAFGADFYTHIQRGDRSHCHFASTSCIT